MSENLILFGAGASYGSQNAGTPPLGTDLFDELRRFNPPGWGGIPDELADIFRNDFEEGMASVPKVNAHLMPPLQRAMAAYFFAFQPSSTNLYCEFAGRISRFKWDGTCATLNYERLLELCLVRSDLRPVVRRPPEKSREVELVLPHGCCHIFCETVQGSSSVVSLRGDVVRTDGTVKVITDPAQFNSRIQNDAFPPVMSYFEPQKQTTTGVGFIKHQRQRWEDLAHSASSIAIVGVGVRPTDTHIWRPIQESGAKVVYCGGPDGAKAYRKWAEEVNRMSNSIILEGYFADEFHNICDELDLQ